MRWPAEYRFRTVAQRFTRDQQSVEGGGGGAWNTPFWRCFTALYAVVCMHWAFGSEIAFGESEDPLPVVPMKC